MDYPGRASLIQIYGTFNRAMLRLIPSLRTYAEPLTNAMVEFYLMSQVCHRGLFEAHFGLLSCLIELGLDVRAYIVYKCIEFIVLYINSFIV